MLLEELPEPALRTVPLSHKERVDWISDPLLYRAVAFVRKYTSKGMDPEEALSKAEEYFHLSRDAILEHAGKLNDPLQYHNLVRK
jgi:hypothetical protein